MFCRFITQRRAFHVVIKWEFSLHLYLQFLYLNRQLKYKCFQFWKQIGATLKFYSELRFCPYCQCHQPHVTFRRPTKFHQKSDIDFSIQPPRCRKSTSGFGFGEVTHLRTSKIYLQMKFSARFALGARQRTILHRQFLIFLLILGRALHQ